MANVFSNLQSKYNAPSNPRPKGANTGNYWWTDPNVLITDQGVPDDKGYLQREPYLLADRYKNIEQEGIYGKGGVDSVMNKANFASALRRRKLGSALKKGRLGQQLGPRSGAIYNLLANKVWAPEMSGLAEKETDMTRENMLSKTSVGTAGLMAIMQFINDRYQRRMDRDVQKDANSAGVLDFIKLIPGIGDAYETITGKGE